MPLNTNRMEYDDVVINVSFNESTSRQNLISGENLSVSLGKIKKYLSDLGDAAYTNIDTALDINSSNAVANSLLTELFTPMTQTDYDNITTKTLPLYFIVEG